MKRFQKLQSNILAFYFNVNKSCKIAKFHRKKFLNLYKEPLYRRALFLLFIIAGIFKRKMFMKVIFIITITILLSACNTRTNEAVIEPTAEGFVKYIACDYQYDKSGEFVSNYIDTTYSTNLYLINMLKSSYDNISIQSCDNDGAFLLCDGTLVRLDIKIDGGKITKIKIKEGCNE